MSIVRTHTQKKSQNDLEPANKAGLNDTSYYHPEKLASESQHSGEGMQDHNGTIKA